MVMVFEVVVIESDSFVPSLPRSLVYFLDFAVCPLQEIYSCPVEIEGREYG